MQFVNTRRSLGGALAPTTEGRKALLLALTLGLLAAYLAWMYVQRAGTTERQAALVPVLVAASDIPVRTEIKPEMVTVKQVPADVRLPNAFTSLDQIKGKVTSLPIVAGEQVLNSKFFERKQDSGLAFQVPPGKRGVSVGVNEVTISGGLIVPGDFVDVLAIFPAKDENSNAASVTLQNIEVLAVAQALQGQPEGGTGPLGTGAKPEGRQEAVARPNARTVTLAVTPQEAERLILAEQGGSIRLALRGVDDHDTVTVEATRLTDLKP